MNDQDYIKRAVELADGWERKQFGYFLVPDSHMLPNGSKRKIAHGPGLDALAAQLVRQVDATVYSFGVGRGMAQCYNSIQQGHDRTMNTIKAIVDSGVLGA